MDLEPAPVLKNLLDVPGLQVCDACSKVPWKKFYDPDSFGGYSPMGQGPVKLGPLASVLSRSQSCISCKLAINALRFRHEDKVSNPMCESCVVTYILQWPGNDIVEFGKHVMRGGYSRKDLPSLIVQLTSLNGASAEEDIYKVLLACGDGLYNARVRPLVADVDLFKRWMAECDRDCTKDTSHKAGCTNLPVAERSNLRDFKLRLIDVTRGCIFEAPRDQAMPRYVALSYVWGTCPVLRLLKSNVESLGKDGALWKEKLPKTITDALDLVNRLEEHYLWVDALCITQDDPEEMQSSIPCMNTIYQTASLTVIAAAGNSADAGLPGLRLGTRWHAPKNFEVGPLRYITSSTSTRDQFEFLQGSYWSTRGWTFQEGHLSRRRLVFTNEQVFWSCSKFSRCEEVRLEDTNRFYPFSTSEASEMVPGNLDVDDRPAVWQDKCLKYYIDGYSYKSLSHDDTDRLNAFKGMISYVAGATKDRFFGGLPCSYFGEKLIWEVFPEQFFEKDWDHTVTKSLPTLQRRHKYPSWSWLDWKGHVYFFYEKESYEPRQIGFYRLENSELIHINSEGSRNRRRNYEYTNNGSGYRAKIPLDEAPQEVRPTVESASHFADYDGFKSLQRDPRIFFYTQSAILNFKPRDCTSKKIMTWEDLRDARTTTTVEGVEIVFSSSSFQHWGYDGPREFIVINQAHLLQETDPDNGLISNDRLTLMEISWKDSTAYRETLATVNEADWRKKVPNVQRKRISLG